ncbi:Bug family tripartite tricarboxylate transporter substrate binding protein [Bordetella sp. H567]|uniref:Bug family tripartite tricarboxylate transporter substrate binding protein n=1 Tax=Bordetella sp. H567 TaxID=1697043 RepID=UPI0013142F2B|nr:tripartite tricarboxylate transporter substrate binding protein [Bordetella sp. H567]
MKYWNSLFATVALAAAVAAPALAAYPEQPIKVVVPYTAGGSSDVIARAISDELSTALGQSVIVENRAGAGSMIGTSYVANEKPDGYTLLLADVPFTIVPALYGDRIKYNAQTGFAPISLLGLSPMYLFVNPAFPAKTVKELIEAARAKPGTISIGSGGNGSLTHLMAALLMLNANIKLVHIPYKGASASVNDLAGGQIDASFTTMPTATALFQGGKIRPIAVSAPQRQKEAPDVPTFDEAGVPNMGVQSWWGLVAPAGTPPAVQEKLSAAMAKVMQSPKVQSRLNSVGVNLPPDTSAAALKTLLTADFARWQDVVKRANITFE